MIAKLRKRHVFTWVVLALLIPVLIVLAYTNVRKMPVQDFSTVQAQALTELIGNTQGNYVLVNIRKQEAKHQVEAVILKPIQAANTMLQLKSGNKNIDLGRLGSKGIYRFDLPKNISVSGSMEVVVYDQIKKVEIEKINISL